MILVDSSVWINFLQDANFKYRERLEKLIVERNQVCICGIVLQEVLQGIRNEPYYSQVKYYLIQFPFLPTQKNVYVAAASIYRTLRKKGITIPSGDATIAAIAIEHSIPLFTLDSEHFQMIASQTSLKLFPL